MGVPLKTELSLEFVNAELLIVPFPLQHTEGDQTARDMVLLSPFRTRLTAGQAQLILAGPDHCLNLRADAIQPTDLRSRQPQAMGGIVLLAVADQGCRRWWRTACPLNRRFFFRRHTTYHP
jgi:hypothetical protein